MTYETRLLPLVVGAGTLSSWPLWDISLDGLARNLYVGSGA